MLTKRVQIQILSLQMMSAIHLDPFIINERARSLSEGLKIVRNIFKSNPFPNGFTTSQLFQVAVQHPPPPDFPAPHPR